LFLLDSEIDGKKAKERALSNTIVHMYTEAPPLFVQRRRK